MMNPFSLSRLETLSESTLARSITVYKRMLSQLGQFSNSSQIQDIRAQVHGALTEIEIEADSRIRVIPLFSALRSPE
jgi:hypothetical protein